MRKREYRDCNDDNDSSTKKVSAVALPHRRVASSTIAQTLKPPNNVIAHCAAAEPARLWKIATQTMIR
jgi:hypothetical protein